MRLGSVGFVVLTLAATNALAEDAPQLTLDDLLKAALQHDGRVLAAYAQLDAYKAQWQEARWLWFPQIKLEGMFGGPVGARRLSSHCANKNTCLELESDWRAGNLDYDEVSFALGGKVEAAMPIYTFGKLSEAVKAAEAGVKAGEYQIDQARQELALEVRRAYYGWLLANSAIEILKDGEETIKEAEKEIEKILDEGDLEAEQSKESAKESKADVDEKDLCKLRTYKADVDALLIQAEQGRNLTLAALRFLTGIEQLGSSGTPLAQIDLEIEKPQMLAREDYLARAKKLRPELNQLQAALDASSAFVEIQRASFYPDFFIAGYFQGSYSPVQEYIENSLLNNGLTNYDGGLALGFRVTLDIPQKIARFNKAKAEYRKLQTQASQAELAIGLEIEKRLEELSSSWAMVEARKKGRKAAKSWRMVYGLDEVVGLLDSSDVDVKDLLEALAAYAKARMELNAAFHNTWVAVDQLKATVGEDLGPTE